MSSEPKESLEVIQRREIVREIARLSFPGSVVYPVLFLVVPAATDIELGQLGLACWLAAVFIGVARFAFARAVLRDEKRAAGVQEQWYFRILSILAIGTWALFAGPEMWMAGPTSLSGIYLLFVFAGLVGGGSANLAADFSLSFVFVATCWVSVAIPCISHDSLSLVLLTSIYCIYSTVQARVSRDRFLFTFEVREKLKQRTEELQVIAEEAQSSEAKAAEANQAKSRFLATMSHEIRTPLHGVLGMNTLLLDTELDADQRQYSEGIENSGKALLGVIEDVLDFSKLEAGKEQLVEEDFNLRLLLENSARILSQAASDKHLELITQISDDLPEALFGDATHLRRILINVIGNAVKYTQHGEIVLSATLLKEQESEVWVKILVSDTGLGISDEDQERLFHPFQQLNRITTGAKGGSGLGLSITQKLTKLLGGELKIESQQGKGSTFAFELPFRRASVDTGIRTEAVKVLQSAQGEHRVLLVEDDPTNQVVLKRLLNKAGYICEVVDNGLRAVQAVSQSDYALVLMDCQMPIMDGYQATRRIKAELADQAPPIVAITANATSEDREHCFEAGMDAFLSKPLRLKALQEVLNRFIAEGE